MFLQERRLFAAAVVVSLLAASGCSDAEAPATKSDETPTTRLEIRDIDFVKDTYFFFNHPNYTFPSRLPQLSTIDVYREVKPIDLLVDPELAVFHAWAVVDTFGDGEDIVDAIDSFAAGVVPSAARYGDFEVLTLGEDYTFILEANTSDEVIGIELLRPITKDEQRMLAVSYVDESGQRSGGYLHNQIPPVVPVVLLPTDTLALELLKDRTPAPVGARGYLWEYMMRNIYDLGFSEIDPASFRVEIEDNLSGNRVDSTTPDSVDVPYVQIFGLDRFDVSGQPGHDQLVDLQAGVVDLRDGFLVFPTLHPFAPPEFLVKEWTDDQFWFKDPKYGGRFVAQYDTSAAMYQQKPWSQRFQDYHQYTIVVDAAGRRKTPASVDASAAIESRKEFQ